MGIVHSKTKTANILLPTFYNTYSVLAPTLVDPTLDLSGTEFPQHRGAQDSLMGLANDFLLWGPGKHLGKLAQNDGYVPFHSL